MTRRTSLLPLLSLVFLASCESPYGHATVHWKRDTPAPAPQAEQTAKARLQEPAVLPATHSGFIYMPGYPGTHRTWKDENLLNAGGSRRVVIDLASQRGLFFINGCVAMDFPVCTGSAEKPTPKGTFTITQKDKNHHSNLYHVPMPWFMRLTNDGIGLHVGTVYRKPSSHGCIRLPQEACKILFSKVALGTPVDIR